MSLYLYSTVFNSTLIFLFYRKMLTFYQRPVPIGAQDIGSWQVIFSLVSVVSVITNAAIVCFTMDVLEQYSYLGRTWLFIGFQWFLISVQFIISAAIPDIPASVQIQSQRSEFIVSKLILHVEDEDYGEEQEDPNGRQSVIDSANPLLANANANKDHSKDEVDVLPDVEIRQFPHSKPNNGWPTVLKREQV